MQKKKGISLITLIITIIVMVILAAVVVINLASSDLIGKSNEAVDKYNESQGEVLELIQGAEENWDFLVGQKEEVLFTGELVGESGKIELPIKLNNTSKRYILDISSALYTGRVVLNVYGLEDGVQRNCRYK